MQSETPFNSDTCRAYFRKAFEFLTEYNWIYKCSNTQYLLADIFNQFPDNWIDCLLNLSNDELNQLPFNLRKV